MARVDKKPCYLGDTQLDMVATSQIIAVRGDPEMKRWIRECNPCRALFPYWGKETEAASAAVANRELTEDYMDPDDMHPRYLRDRKMYASLCRNADIPELSALVRKVKLNNLIMSSAYHWTTGSAAMGHFLSHVILDELNLKLGCIPNHSTIHGIVDNFLTLTGVANCLSRNWTLRAKATNSSLSDLTPGAEKATIAYTLIEFWFKATKDGRFRDILAEMEQSGSTDFRGVEINDHTLPDLGYVPGRITSEKSIRCWKYCSKLYIVVNTRSYVYGYLLGRDHVINLIDRLKSIANVRTFMRTYRTTGINEEKPLDISRAVDKVERYMGERLREVYPDEDSKLPKSMKQVLAVLENDYHMNDIPVGMDTGEDRRRKKLLEGLEEVCKNAHGLVSLFKDLGTYDGIVLDLCYLFHYLPTPDRDIVVTLKTTRDKMTEPRVSDPYAEKQFLGFCEIYDLLVTASKERSVPNYRCVEGKEAEVKQAVDQAIKYGPFNPPEALWGAARLVQHFPYVNTADKAFIQAKDVTRVSASYDEYINPGRSVFARNIQSNELLFSLVKGDDCGQGIKMARYKELFAKGLIKRDNIADLATKAESTKDHLTSRETLSLNEPSRRMLSEMDSSQPILTNYLGNIAMGASRADMDLAFRTFLSKSSEIGSCLFISVDVKGWSPGAKREFFLSHHDLIMGYTQADHGISFKMVWENLRFVCRRDGLNVDMFIDEGMVQGWTGRYDCILHSHLLLYVTAKLRKRGILSTGEGYKGKVMIDDALFCFFFSSKSTKEDKEKKCLLIEDAITEAYADVGLVIAKDKTIISTLNFTFLNRFFSGGAEVVKPIRTMMKLSTSADRMITTFQGQVQDITGSIRGAIEKGADPMVMYVMALRLIVSYALQWDSSISKSNIISLIPQMIAPSYMGGWGVPAFIDFITKEKTDPMRVINMYIQGLVEVDETAECYEEVKKVVGAIYLAKFRNPNVYAFMSNPTIPAYQGVDDPTSSLRRILRNLVRCGNFCKEMVNAAVVDSDPRISEALWEIVLSCTWDPAILESSVTMRPYASQMKLLTKLMECESCRKLLSPSQLARCRQYAKIHSKTAVSPILRRCSLDYPDSSLQRVISIAKTRPPCELTKFILDSYYAYLGVSMVNYAMPDPLEVVVRPNDDKHVMVVAKYEPPLSSGSDVTDISTGNAWSSPGFDYADMHTGRARKGRDVTKVSRGIFDVTNPAYRSLPLESKTIHQARAVTVCLNSRGLSGEKLWEAELAMNGLYPDEDTLLCMVQVSPSVSTKRMTRATQQTNHSVVAYPNASGCVTLCAPRSSGGTGDLDLMTQVSDKRGKSINVKSFHVTLKALTIIEASLSSRVELSIGFGMREGTLRVLEDSVFTIDNPEAFDAAIERLRDLVRDLPGNPIKEAMSYASNMGARVGVIYDAHDDDWDDEITNDNPIHTATDPELPRLQSVPLPPLGLPSISSRRSIRKVPVESLTQRPDRDKVSESVMQKYNRIPPEERCYIRMKLDLLLTLTTHIVKLQPRVREIVLSMTDRVSQVKRENALLSDSEVDALMSGIIKVVSITNDTLKTRCVDNMASSVCGTNLCYADALNLCRALNSLDNIELWHAVALYRIAHGKVTSSYLTVIVCNKNLKQYKKWLEAQSGFCTLQQPVQDLYRLACDVVRSSRSYRDFVVSTVKHLTKVTKWADKKLSELLLISLGRRCFHRDELNDLREDIPCGVNNPYREHWTGIVLGALSAYGEIDIIPDQIGSEAEVSEPKKMKFSLSDLNLDVGDMFESTPSLGLGNSSRLEGLRMTCIAITQLGLDVMNLVDIYMSEGQYAAVSAVQERRNPIYHEENDAYYLENHLNTWIEEFYNNHPADWFLDPRVMALIDLEVIVNTEVIDQSALEADDNE